MGLPRVLTTDNDSEFKNKLNAEMMKLLGIRQCLITPYYPQVHSLQLVLVFELAYLVPVCSRMVLTKDLIKPCRGCLSMQLQDERTLG